MYLRPTPAAGKVLRPLPTPRLRLLFEKSRSNGRHDEAPRTRPVRSIRHECIQQGPTYWKWRKNYSRFRARGKIPAQPEVLNTSSSSHLHPREHHLKYPRSQTTPPTSTTSRPATPTPKPSTPNSTSPSPSTTSPTPPNTPPTPPAPSKTATGSTTPTTNPAAR